MESVYDWIHILYRLNAITSSFLSQLPTKNCYKYEIEIACRTFFPECIQAENQVIYICRETCLEFLDACLPHLNNYMQKINLLPVKVIKEFFGDYTLNLSNAMNCDYLPSVDGPIRCFYKPVTCESPPNVTNARIVNETNVIGNYSPIIPKLIMSVLMKHFIWKETEQ